MTEWVQVLSGGIGGDGKHYVRGSVVVIDEFASYLDRDHLNMGTHLSVADLSAERDLQPRRANGRRPRDTGGSTVACPSVRR